MSLLPGVADPKAMAAQPSFFHRLRQAILDVLNPLIPAGSRCALVDYPAHPNVGDSAIWLGEKAYLRDRGVTVAYTCDTRNYSPASLERALRDGLILIHGGGNFGDLWPHHHTLRLKVLRDLPGRQIIQLPQTVHFQSDSALPETRRAIDYHGNFQMIARDRRSQSGFVKDFSRACFVAPDMALYLACQNARGTAVSDFFWLKRSDKESPGATGPELASGTPTQDWLQDGKRLRQLVEFLGECKKRSLPIWRLERALYDAFARARVRRGYRTLRQGRVVITERLHGHILCLLAGIPNVLIDNNYGKNSAFYETWTSGSPGAYLVQKPAQAMAKARELLRGLDVSGPECG
jgi:pyruvyl transferase EpsO